MPAGNGRERLNQKTLAQRLDLDVRQIRNLEKQGLPCRAAKGAKVYPWPEALHWYLKFKVEAATQRLPGRQRLLDVRIRREEINADREALDMARELGELVPSDVHRKVPRQMLEQIRNQLATLPTRWFAELDGVATATALRTKLEDLAEAEKAQVERALLAITAYQEWLATAEAAGDEDDDADAAA